jgi:predicted transcriptional regulator
MAGKHPDATLSDLQFDLMRALWSRGEASTTDLSAALESSRGLAHTTIATVLSRLEKRGIVRSRRDGRQLVYRACVAEADVRRSMVASLLGTLFSGDAKALVAHLLREDEIAAGDLDRVKKLLARENDRG